MSSDPFSHSVLARDIPPGGKRYHVEADQAERDGLAAALGIPAVAALSGDLEIHPLASRGFRVRGRLEAQVVQEDVVTLNPITQVVAEEVDVTLMPAETVGARPSRGEVFVDAAEEDGPDLFHNGRIDLGVILSEHLALGLDPYPRAAETQFAGHVESDSTTDPSPFAALKTLRDRGG